MVQNSDKSTRLIKIEGLQYLRGIAAISVITIHTLNSAVIYFGTPNSLRTLIVECIKNCMWWGVPSFLMITGWLLLSPEKNITYKKIYKHYIPRMLEVLVVFAIPFSWMELIFDTHSINTGQILTAAYNVLTGNTWAHLWYVYALIGIYILLPIWRLITSKATKKDMKYITAVYIVFLMICPILRLFNMDFSGSLRIDIVTIYPCWMFLGYMFSKKWVVIKKKVAVWLLCISIVLLILITVLNSMNGIRNEIFFSYSSIIVLFQACAIFSLISPLKLKANSIIRRLFLQIGDKSFGIYIVHMVFINVFYKALKVNPFDSIFVLPILILCNLVFSWGCTYIMKHLPILRKII